MSSLNEITQPRLQLLFFELTSYLKEQDQVENNPPESHVFGRRVDPGGATCTSGLTHIPTHSSADSRAWLFLALHFLAAVGGRLPLLCPSAVPFLL